MYPKIIPANQIWITIKLHLEFHKNYNKTTSIIKNSLSKFKREMIFFKKKNKKEIPQAKQFASSVLTAKTSGVFKSSHIHYRLSYPTCHTLPSLENSLPSVFHKKK